MEKGYIGFQGLPVFGLGGRADGLHQVPSLTVRGLTIQPCWIRVKDGDIVAYGQQPHCWMWEDRKVV